MKNEGKKEDIKNLFFLLFIVSVFTLFLFIYLWRNIQIANLDMEIDRLKKEKKKLYLEVESINLTITSSSTPEKIEKILQEHDIHLPVRTGKSIISVKLPPLSDENNDKSDKK